MRPSATRLTGVMSPVLTPFDANGSPSVQRFIAHCHWLVRQQVGLSVFGTNSEATSLALAEKRDLLDALLDSGIPPSRLMPGTGACSIPDTVELTRHAVNAGCAGVLMLPPFYYKGVSDEGLFRYFAQVIEKVGHEALRVYLYHIPPVTQIGISLALIERLIRAFPQQIAGVKDSSGDWKNTLAMIEQFQPAGFDVFAGTETVLLETMRAGGVGCITATGNVNPGAINRLYATWQSDDADAQQAAINVTRAVFQSRPIIPAMKAAIAWKSGDAQWAAVRPPLVELDAAQCRALQQDLTANGFDIPDAQALALKPSAVAEIA